MFYTVGKMIYYKKTKIITFLVLFIIINNISAQDLKCTGCKKSITEKYIVIDEEPFHPNCFVCSKCNRPINGNYYKKDGKIFDAQCYTNFCDVCGEPLMGKYKTDIYGIKFHPHHENELNRCDNCNMMISQKTTKGGVTYSDGRNICNICRKKVVTTDTEYSRSLKSLISALRNYGLNISLNNVEVNAVDRDELKRVSNSKYSNSARGYCETIVEERRLGSTTEVTRSHTIYILDRVPKKYIEATLAHELMHVWINENVKHRLSSQLEEGSCNFISYTYLKSDYSEDAQNLIKQMKDNPDPIYGDGFRKVYSNFKGKYLSELLNYLKRYKTL